MRPLKVCTKCRQLRQFERHHILPIRHFGRKGNRLVFRLCQRCHKDIEHIITKAEDGRGKLTESRYFQILFTFLEEV